MQPLPTDTRADNSEVIDDTEGNEGEEKTIVDGGSRQGLSHLAHNLISSVQFG